MFTRFLTRLNSSVMLLTSTIFVITLCISWKHLPITIDNYVPNQDRKYYEKIALGKYSEVIKPFSKRVLHPIVARSISSLSSLSLNQSFFIISIISLIIFISFILWIIKNESSFPLAMTIPLLVTPYMSLLFYDYYMHDLFFSTVLIAFFVFFIKKLWPLMFLSLYALFLIREATILLSLILIISCIIKKEPRILLGVIIATGLGLVSSSYFAGLGQENRHALGELIFMISKIIHNTFSNFFGINLWVNTYKDCHPILEINIVRHPDWLSFGKITNFGVCDFNLLQPLHTLIRYLSSFGLIPLLFFYIIKREGKKIIEHNDLWFISCLLFGLVSFVIGPCLGPGGYRLMGYGWPLFWIVCPILMSLFIQSEPATRNKIVIIHVVLTWILSIMEILLPKSELLYPLTFSFILILYVLAFSQLKKMSFILSNNE